MQLQFDIKRITLLKDILLRLRDEESTKLIQQDIDVHFKDVSHVDFLLTILELLKDDEKLTIDDVKRLLSIYPGYHVGNERDVGGIEHPGHPVHIFKQENAMFQTLMERMTNRLELLESGQQDIQETDVIEELMYVIARLGEFHKHYHRKEKLFFPIMERYGYYNPIRISWRADDVVRALYQGMKRQINRLPHIDLSHVRIMHDRFEKAFRDMLFQEEEIILPVFLATFDEADWLAIAKESDAFGYVTTESKEEWVIASTCEAFIADKEVNKEAHKTANVTPTSKNLPFGGGYLTIEEANLILNHLPLEITFVDKNSVFKYFNNITEASDMMFVRTPISIGRNVANCHPPKSLKKVMRLIRDLKTKKRTSESMWFKKKDQFVHITYKGVFNEKDEFIGILEYVQDIQPFFELPSDVKRVLTTMDDE